ncbi:conserved hypothetical protein [Sphingomonas sp. EC-HK361]|uniref:hypothetical protein n=1 Tax=Sphingomonas sp. EC-HK361 TaxID=2038397 RepID=UPI0012593A4F|nr:hypothetical protein [Sphingomonas sp. EC-HK361]VVT20943.1 conserved hypothetical protein [Sphingomonas sp. EC-HK361]
MANDDAARDAAFEHLAECLHSYERLLRDNFASMARLQGAACEAQRLSGVGSTVGHQFLRAVTSSSVGITDALSHIADGHRLLEQLGKRLGYDVSAYGDGIKDPAPGFTTGSADPLHAAG